MPEQAVTARPEAIELTLHAKEVGADATLQVTPYYNKPTQEGLYRHFREIGKKGKLPVVLYNVPSRTSINLLPDTVARLAELDEIVAIKEASGSITQMTEVVLKAGDNITILSGDDGMLLPLLSVGGKGVISVASNIVPRLISDICELWLNGNPEAAKEKFLYAYDLCKGLFIETNPIPVKTAVAMMGMASEEMRMPMCAMGEENRKKLKALLERYNLI